MGYKVCLSSNASLCDSAIAVVYVNLPVGMNDIKENSIFRVYPNPAEDFINIYLDGEKSPELIQLLDMSGKICFETRNIHNRYPLRIKSQDMESGIYLVKIYSGDKIVSKKIVKK